jgi:hypothetical protein
MMRCDLSLSFLSWEPSAISEARKRKFSTCNAEICALRSSIRTLSVELSLIERSERDECKGDMNGLCDMLIGKEELLLDCKMRDAKW